MKTTIIHYLITFMIILIPSFIVSLILSILSYFIQFHGLIFDIIIQILSYMILIIASLYFSSKNTSHRIIHCLMMSLIYGLFHLALNIDSINIINMICKSSLFLIIGILKEYTKKRWNHSSFYLYSIFKILTS